MRGGGGGDGGGVELPQEACLREGDHSDDAEEALGDCEVYYEDQMTPPANDNMHMGVI